LIILKEERNRNSVSNIEMFNWKSEYISIVSFNLQE